MTLIARDQGSLGGCWEASRNRTLTQAVSAALLAMAAEIAPFDEEQADQFAGRISGEFGQWVPVRLPSGQLTRLEALRAAVAGQLSVLDDADLLGVSVRPVHRTASPLPSSLSPGNYGSPGWEVRRCRYGSLPPAVVMAWGVLPPARSVREPLMGTCGLIADS